jgi:hypothetical protein
MMAAVTTNIGVRSLMTRGELGKEHLEGDVEIDTQWELFLYPVY